MEYVIDHTIGDNFEEGKTHRVVVSIWGIDPCQVERVKKFVDMLKNDCTLCECCIYKEMVK